MNKTRNLPYEDGRGLAAQFWVHFTVFAHNEGVFWDLVMQNGNPDLAHINFASEVAIQKVFT
jgi:hypothetical protein